MSEGIIIALITAIGSLVGGIVGNIITASATRDAAKIKEKINLPSSNKEEKPRSWGTVIGGALVGAIATLIVLFLLGMIPPKPENPPIATPVDTTPVSKTESSATTSGNSSILFNEDFEDGKAQKLAYISGGWQIIADETGNKVFDIDNSKGSGFPGIDFGSENWKDYEIKFRVRFLDSSGSWLITYFRKNWTSNSGYAASTDLSNTSLNSTTNGNYWKGITNREYKIQKNIWYWIRIEAKGTEIKVSVNDFTAINTDDALYNAGGITMQAGQYTHMQIDDIQVASLEK